MVSTTVGETVRVERVRFWRWFETVELSRIFTGYGSLPAVVRTSDQAGPWDTVGSSRTVHLSDGSSVHEQITLVAPPGEFGYTVTGFKGLLGRLTREAHGRWEYEATGERATAVRWTYSFVPRSALLAPALWLLSRTVWAGYMRAGMASVKRMAEADERHRTPAPPP